MAVLTLLAAAGAVALLIFVVIVLRKLSEKVSAEIRTGLRLQEPQIRAVRDAIATVRSDVRQDATAIRTEMAGQAAQQRTELNAQLSQSATDLTAAVQRMSEANEHRMEALRSKLDEKLHELYESNAKHLEEIRATVSEKLQTTLEARLSDSFRSVSEQLERVQRGLGEMQELANGVGDLKRVLTNVKTRGTWGEVQLEAILDQMLAPDQYAKNVAVKPGASERVEFAVKLPGRDGSDMAVWLPIDAKFPQAEYERLLGAQESADAEGAEAASVALEQRLRKCAGDIRDKYVEPPHTTDIAIMFVPTEGLYAFAAQRRGLLAAIQESRVLVAGPSTLAALLSALQMGFRTLAVEQRASEVWKTLVQVKSEFEKFELVLGRLQKKLEQAGRTIETAQTRTRVMKRKLATWNWRRRQRVTNPRQWRSLLLRIQLAYRWLSDMARCSAAA